MNEALEHTRVYVPAAPRAPGPVGSPGLVSQTCWVPCPWKQLNQRIFGYSSLSCKEWRVHTSLDHKGLY